LDSALSKLGSKSAHPTGKPPENYWPICVDIKSLLSLLTVKDFLRRAGQLCWSVLRALCSDVVNPVGRLDALVERSLPGLLPKS
jgi:hypothetical protein